MIPQPSIVATDDNGQHLDAIARCIQKMGASCLPLVFREGGISLERELNAVRLLFFDLHYVPGTPRGPALYDIAAGVLEEIVRPGNGPYVLIIWSSHVGEYEDFLRHVSDGFPDIPPPSASAFMDKTPFIVGGEGGDAIAETHFEALAQQIQAIIDGNPQVSALLNWEDTARAAAGDVIDSITGLVPREACFLGESGPELERLLLAVARAAVGKTSNIEADRVYAINEGLGPILLDQLINATAIRRAQAVDHWKSALPDLQGPSQVTQDQKAALNASTLVSSRDISGVAAGDRGAVSALNPTPGENGSPTVLGRSHKELVGKYLDLLENNQHRNEEREELLGSCRWVFVGYRAACDQSYQRGSYLRRVCLALEVPSRFLDVFKPKKHGARYMSPEIRLNDESVKLIFNWHFAVALTEAKLESSEVQYRLREPLISEIAISLHVHGFRPGIISYN